MQAFLNILKHNWIKYGFETVVVTVGILGAFTLESWKDNRQEDKELLVIYGTIADDLHSDSLSLVSYLEDYESRLKNMQRILTEEVSKEEWIENDSLYFSFTGFSDFRASTRGLDLLKTNITTGGEAGILAGQISQFYNTKLLRNDVTLRELNDILFHNVKHWMDNEAWLSSSLIDRDRTLLAEYVVDNPYFRNRVATYMVLFANYYRSLKEYQEEGAELAEEINAFLEEEQ